MRKRFYIATRLEQTVLHQHIARAMRAAGWQLTYDWTTHGSVTCQGLERIREVAHDELAGVFAADVVIVALPGGRGTHAQLGMALAYGRPVVLYTRGEEIHLDGRTCAFYHHALVRQAANLGELLAACEEAYAARQRRGTETTESWPIAVLLAELARLEEHSLEHQREAAIALSPAERVAAQKEAEGTARLASDVEVAVARLVDLLDAEDMLL